MNNDVVYMGYSDVMVECLIRSEDFHLCGVLGVKGRMNQRIYNLIKKYSLPYKEISCAKELGEIEAFISKETVIIMYMFEFILPQDMVDKYSIFNFHRGNLRYNRGAHAIVRTILNLDTDTCLSLYQLTGGIDEGNLIGEFFVKVSNMDNVITLNQRLIKGIPRLLQNLKEYLNGERQGELITGGKYYSKIEEKDYIINMYEDSITDICAKIRSQIGYKGAVLVIDDKRYRVKNYEYSKNEKKTYFRTCEKGRMIIKEGYNILWCDLEEEVLNVNIYGGGVRIEQIKQIDFIQDMLILFSKSMYFSYEKRGIDINEYANKLYQNAVIYIAFIEEIPVGIMAFYCNDVSHDYAYLTLLAIMEEYRKLGIATMLLETLIKQCEDMKYIQLEVDKKNEAAIRLYEKMNFKKSENASESSVYMVRYQD